MVETLVRRLCTACVAALVAAAPAAADTETTGGTPAIDVPALSPQGGVSDLGAPAPVAQPARSGGRKAEQSAETAPPAPANTPPPEASAAQTPPRETVSSPPAGGQAGGGGSGLPHTGFALAALVALGTGFVLTGYALRYSRALDG